MFAFAVKKVDDELGAPRTRRTRQNRNRASSEDVVRKARAAARSPRTSEVPKNSRCKYVGTFIGSGGTLALVSPIGIGYQVWKRANLKNSEQAVKSKFEQQFDDVRTATSTGGGAMEVEFTTRSDFANKPNLRTICDSLMQSATGYKLQTSFLEVTKIGEVSTNRDIENSPTRRRDQLNQNLTDFTNAVGNTTRNVVEQGGAGFLSNLGITMPVVVLVAVIVGVVMLKK